MVNPLGAKMAILFLFLSALFLCACKQTCPSSPLAPLTQSHGAKRYLYLETQVEGATLEESV